MLGHREGRPIYVNEHLTQRNKALLSPTVKRKKDARWKYVWTSSGRVLARRNEDSPVVRISDEKDLDHIRAES